MTWACKKVSQFIDIDQQEAARTLWIASIFFCAIGSYTIFKEMKNSLFIALVGVDSIFTARLLSVLILIPATFYYSKLVDTFDKYKLLRCYVALYVFGTLLIAILLQKVDLQFAHHNPAWQWNLLGWLVYFFYEGQNPFIIGLFWSFTHTIVSAEVAKKSYPFIVGISRLGGICMGTIGWAFFKYGPICLMLDTVHIYQILFCLGACLLAIIPFLFYFAGDSSSKKLHQSSDFVFKKDKKFFSAWALLQKNRYVVAIIASLFFYEFLYVTLSMHRIIILRASAHSLCSFNEIIFQQRIAIHVLSLIGSFWGAGFIIKRCGERASLLVTPLISTLLLLFLFLKRDESLLLGVYVILVSLHGAVEKPLREMLYIPLTDKLRFKTRGWENLFGVKCSAVFGAAIGGLIQSFARVGSLLFLTIYFLGYIIISFFWIKTAWFLGRKYELLMKNNRVVN